MINISKEDVHLTRRHILIEQMVSASFIFSLRSAPYNFCASKFQASSVISSLYINELWSKRFDSRTILLARRRNAVVSCSSLVHEADVWTFMQPHFKSYWFLISPSILLPLLASGAYCAESRRRLVEISDSTRSVFSRLIPLLLLLSARWQGLQRCTVQILAVLLLVNAFYANIAAPYSYDTFENVPQNISGGEVRKRIQKPKSKKAELCTQKCVGTCVRGGAGAPGEGPFNIRKPLVVFKEGFRSRQYCLIECSDICNLIGDGDDGP